MSAERHAAIVFDLGFGDAGKGLVTDYWVRSRGARVVVRFNGGAQAGHNVITPDGRHHTFAQLGAGTFVPGVETVLSQHMVVHPTALAVEAEHLASLGVQDALARLLVSERALVVTPFQQAAGRLRELARGASKHGSCGAGVGETVRDALAAEHDALRIRDLRPNAGARARLIQLQADKRAELAPILAQLEAHPLAAPERAILERADIADRWLEAAIAITSRIRVRDDAALSDHILACGSAVFEGAQGVLLDEWRGFHPYTTWSTCTPDSARALAEPIFGARALTTIGVLRTFATRHGAGPFPTERADRLGLDDPHNVAGPWQGALRIGDFDAVLARYALEVSGHVDGIALTHLDALARIASPALCDAYLRSDGTRITRLPPSAGRDLEHQARLTALLERITPALTGARGDFVDAIEHALARPVVLTSHGPTAHHVRERSIGR